MNQRRLVVGAVVGVAFVACDPAFTAGYPIRKGDQDAWRGVPLIELETHEIFSTMEREVRQLSDGHTMWMLVQCKGGGTHCRGGAVAIPNGAGGATAFGSANCVNDDPKCCYHQFVIEDGYVASYHARGQPYVCRATCANWPQSSREKCPPY